jgi:hypothetical protein
MAWESLSRWLVRAAAVFVCLPAAAQPPAPAPQAPENWIADQLRAGKPADFVARCDVSTTDPAGHAAADACRRISGAYLAKLMTGQIVPTTAWPVRGLELSHALISGMVDLTGGLVSRRVSIRNSEFSDLASLSDSKFEQSLTLECDVFRGGFQGLSLHVNSNLSLQASHFVQKAFLVGVQTGGFLWAGGGAFDDGVDFGNAHIGLTFSMSSVSAALCGGTGPKIQATAPHGFALDSAETGGNLQLEGIFGHLDGHDAISAHAVRVHGLVGLKLIANGGIDLRHSNISGAFYMGGSKLTGALKASGIRVDDDVTLSGSNVGDKIDFSDAVLGRDFVMRGALRAKGSTAPLSVNLENAHLTRLSDDAAAWQGLTHNIAGLTYDSLVPPDQPMHAVKDWRRSWLSSDQSQDGMFDPQPYRQLATVLSNSGDKDGAVDVTFWAREQERHMAYVDGQYWKYVGLTFLYATVGYGIGNYIFIPVIWAIVLTLAGAYVLGWSAPARQKGVMWRLQASLDRLLPVIELSPEFGEFFSDPDTHGLNSWQILFFSVVAITGWILGAFLAAALSGLTQSAS